MITRAKSKRLRNNKNTGSLSQNEQTPIQPVPKRIQTLQNLVFEEFQMFSQEEDIDIEGLTYQQINKNQKMKKYLQNLKANLPQYSAMSSHQKAFYFKKISNRYTNNCSLSQQTQEKPQSEKKRVSFSKNEKVLVFDKKECPEQVGFVKSNQEVTKF